LDNDLQKAIQLVKSGNKIEGGRILAKLVKAEPDNEQAWLWLSTCVISVEQKRYCLKQALRINPKNEHTKKQLDRLEEFQPVINVPPLSETPVKKEKSEERYAHRKRNKINNVSKYLVGCFGLLLLTSLCSAGVWILQRQGFFNSPIAGNSPIFPQSIKPLSEFNDENIQKSLLTPNDLTFAGIYAPNDWTVCPTSDENFSDQRDNASQIDPSVRVTVRSFSTNSSCSSDGTGGGVTEVIFLFSGSRYAERYLETAKIQEQKIPLFSYEILETSNGESDFWIMRSQIEFESSTLLVQVDEVVIMINVFNPTRLLVDDLTEIGNSAVLNIRTVQKQ